MTDNIVSAISSFLTPELIGKMGSSLGLDRAVAQKAVDASVPTVLGALANLVSQPNGARQLTEAIAKQPTDMLGSLGSALSGALGGSGQLADKGGSILTSLLGGGTLGTLVSSLSSFVGIGEGATRGLLGLLTPAILGVLGQEQRASGMDTNGLARMLTGQRDQIAAAMPAGLSDILKSKGLRPSMSASPTPRGPTYEAPPRTYESVRSASRDVPPMLSEPKAASTGATWPYWVLPALALAGLLWYMLPGDHAGRQAAEPPRTSTAETTLPKTVSVPTRVIPSPEGKSFLARPSDDSLSVSAYHNQDVYNGAGERLGTMKDILIGSDGRISGVVIGVGQFLGIGEKDVAVPFSVIQIEQRNGNRRLVIDVMKEGLRAAPAFGR